MDHEIRELLGNIVGVLEVIKKDIKVIKQEIYVLNSHHDEPNISNRSSEESPQQIKALDQKRTKSFSDRDQLKTSRLA